MSHFYNGGRCFRRFFLKGVLFVFFWLLYVFLFGVFFLKQVSDLMLLAPVAALSGLPRAKAEDLRHDGPLAPGVLTPNCHADGPPLLKELNPKFVASASLGQVWVSTLTWG